MVTIMYLWRIHPDKRDEFFQEWQRAAHPSGSRKSQLLQGKLYAYGKDVILVNKFANQEKATGWAQRPVWKRFLSRWNGYLFTRDKLVLKAQVGHDPAIAESVALLTIDRIQGVVANCFGVSKDVLALSKRRRPDWVFPRHVAIWFCAEFLPRSYPEIGSKFSGGMDHSSVKHGYDRIEALLKGGFVFPKGGKFAHKEFDGRSLSRVIDEIKVELGLPTQASETE